MAKSACLAAAAAALAASPGFAAGRCADHPVMRKALALAAAPLQHRFAYRGTYIQPDQSYRPTAPYAPQPWRLDMTVDEPAAAAKYHMQQAIAGDFNFQERAAYFGAGGYALDYLGRHEPVPAAKLHSGFVPKAMLQAIAAQSECEDRPATESGDVVHVVSYAGGSRDLAFDKLGRLREVRRAPQPTAFGPLRRDTLFGAYRQVDGAWVPGTISLRFSDPVHGTVESVLRLSHAGRVRLTERDMQLPPGAAPAPAKDTAYRVIPKGEGVYLLRNVTAIGRITYNVLLVGQGDQVVVYDAPADGSVSEKVMAEARRLFPGKRLTLVLSHPHGDHIAGVKPYMTSGATIVAPRGTPGLLDRLRTDSKQAFTVREVPGTLTLGDPDNPVELYDFPTPHSEHLIVAYLPRQRLLMQADLILQGDYPAHAHSRALLEWIKARKLDVAEIAGVHGESVRPGEPLL